MNKITEWIKRHQVLAFVILVYAIAWPGTFLAYFIYPGNDLVEILAMPFVLFSPALIAMLISGIAEPRPKYERSKTRWIAFVLSWLLSGIILILYGWKINDMPIVVNVIVHSLLALFPAWILSSAFSRIPGIRKQFSTLLKPRGPAIWYLVIFLIFPGALLMGFYITRFLGGDAWFFLADLSFGGAAVVLFLEFARVFLMTGGINEESGWRGFALPRLQARYPVIVAALIVGYLWSFLHLPFDFGEGVSLTWILENRLLWTPLFGILMTWIYNRTNGSLLAPVLFHSAMNAFGNNFSFTTAGNIIYIGLAIYAILSERMWEKLPSDHPAVYQKPGLDT
jgi:membrane protease YdiL (CAAX protease family)